MRKFTNLALSLLLLPSSILMAQQPGNSNELHAIFIEKNPFAANYVKDQMVDPPYLNVNISGNPAPQNEPSVRISRTNSNIVVAAWRDFRLGYLEPDVVRRIGYSYSTDGGQTWAESQLLPDPLPDHISQSDPVVACDMDGNFYISSTSRQPVSYYNREMLLYKSTDNGQTFQLHATAVPGSGYQGEDKEWIFVDPVETNPTYNHMMIVWRSFGPDYGIKFRKSDPGGANWSPTVNVGDGENGQGANVTTGIEGQVIVVWLQNGIKYDISYNGGESFGNDHALSYVSSNNNYSFPFICTDYSVKPTRGNIYVIWADARYGSGDDIFFQRSEDGGNTWLPNAIQVNDVSTNNQYWPVIQCDTYGRLTVVYYDEREGFGQMNAWFAYSDDAGNTWTNERLSDIAFPGNQPNSNVRFGDYINIDAFNGKIVPVWTDDRAGNYDQEIYTAVIDLNTLIAENSNTTDASSYQNYPNPFRGKTVAGYKLQVAGYVEFRVFDITGNEVATLVNEKQPPGEYEVEFNAQDLPAGVFYYRLTVEKYAYTKKMVILK